MRNPGGKKHRCCHQIFEQKIAGNTVYLNVPVVYMARDVMILLRTNPSQITKTLQITNTLQIKNILQIIGQTQFRRLDRNSGNLYRIIPLHCFPLMHFTKLRLQPCFHRKIPLALDSLALLLILS